jgi:hypothetical protein
MEKEKIAIYDCQHAEALKRFNQEMAVEIDKIDQETQKMRDNLTLLERNQRNKAINSIRDEKQKEFDAARAIFENQADRLSAQIQQASKAGNKQDAARLGEELQNLKLTYAQEGRDRANKFNTKFNEANTAVDNCYKPLYNNVNKNRQGHILRWNQTHKTSSHKANAIHTAEIGILRSLFRAINILDDAQVAATAPTGTAVAVTHLKKLQQAPECVEAEGKGDACKKLYKLDDIGVEISSYHSLNVKNAYGIEDFSGKGYKMDRSTDDACVEK